MLDQRDQRKPHDLPLTLANMINDAVSGATPRGHPEIMRHHEEFDFVPGNRSLSAVEVGLVNVMCWETVLRQYVDSVKRDYDYVLVPVQADYLAAEDMTELVGTVQSIKGRSTPS